GEKDKGLEVIMGRLRAGKHVTEELIALFKERASIEEDYSKRLTKLAKTFDTSEEGGTLRESIDIVRRELESSARVHLDTANEIRTKLEKPLGEFLVGQSSVRKTHQTSLERQLKAKHQLTAAVFKARERYEKSCRDVAQYSDLANQPGLAQKDLDKARSRLDRAQNQSRQCDGDYLHGVERLADAHRRWVDDFRVACNESHRLEEERIETSRSYLWNFTNLLSSACVQDDEAQERVRSSLEKCDAHQDLQTFIETSTTGSDIPVPPSYVNYYTKTAERGNSGAYSPGGFAPPLSINEISPPTSPPAAFSGSGGGGGVGSSSFGSFGGGGGSDRPHQPFALSGLGGLFKGRRGSEAPSAVSSNAGPPSAAVPSGVPSYLTTTTNNNTMSYLSDTAASSA
ncbi:hypothetical protein HK405_015522, partial [Cladochytrium tenue]